MQEFKLRSGHGLASVAACLLFGCSLLAQSSTPPATHQDDVKETLHGVTIADPYRWLEDQNSPKTRAWIAAQNEYTDSFLKHCPDRAALTTRFGELLKVDTQSAPVVRKGRYFFSRRLATQDQAVLYMRQGLDGPDQVLVDPHSLSADHTMSVSMLAVSDDGNLMAYGIRQGGEDEVAIRILNVGTKKELPDQLPRARYFGFDFNRDATGVYFTRFEKEGPRVYYHALGSDPTMDKKIFGDGYSPARIISADLSDNGRFLLITVSHGSAAMKTEIYFQDLEKQGPITPLVNDITARFHIEAVDERAFINTNWEAPNGRILAVDLTKPARENWREVIPAGPSAIQGYSLVGGKLVVTYLEDVTSRIKLFDAQGKHDRDVKLPGLGSSTGLHGRWGSTEAFFSYTSFAYPATVFRYEMASGATSTWFKPKIPIDPDRFVVEQVFYKSKDDTRIPMFVVYPKGMKRDGSNPTLLTAYGGFNISRTPLFSAMAAVWLEQGGVYALANLRGGGEYGENWHKAGMLEKKQNVFDDFHAAAQYLIDNKFTSPAHLGIQGGSNGGLLVGAALTQKPELFGAVICAVPLLDMVRYHKFLVARFWTPEYGSAEDPKQFPYIYAYSPYHHVENGGKYPAVMFVSGDSDTRVDPLHARKMCALLQAKSGSGKPVLLHYDTKGGHSGGKPVSKQIEDAVDELCFLLMQLKSGKAGH